MNGGMVRSRRRMVTVLGLFESVELEEVSLDNS